ncbi:ATP synthase gamma chain [Tistrella bauzanensis]|uniref:ATP synthase gamma chain n=1 Tax=Tistrella bauzanensis TaxID=657419 RepID=A0ABQ1IAT4_9PROT|nr:F0F1 ATP synthase subunit gamma [Tistrella bauzanensis]GGB31711.1 ATP synthase gamma chain [Tistrella bauzanensis]
MPNLKNLKVRIASVKATQKITKAMQMVAASKLRRATEQVEASRPYAERMDRVLRSLASRVIVIDTTPKLLAGTGRDDVHLLIVATADRGLCGGFNTSIVRAAKRQIQVLVAQGKTVKVLCVGRKGRDQLRREYGHLIVETIEGLGRKRLAFSEAQQVGDRVIAMYEAGEFDVATMVYSQFKSAITQIVTLQQLVPFAAPDAANDQGEVTGGGAVYDYEPEEEAILADLLPRNISIQIFKGLLENAASEQGARMTAMDNATRNAGDMIGKLTLEYNRTRQAVITRELIEIISGAEAL